MTLVVKVLTLHQKRYISFIVMLSTMKIRPLIVAILFVCMFASPVLSAESGRISYISIDHIDIELVDDVATINVDYRIDDMVSFLVMLLGKSDLKYKIGVALNFEDAKFIRADLDHAILVVRGISYDYGDGSYWFPEHQFGIMLPEIVVKTPQSSRNFTNTDIIPHGIGYFGEK